MLLKLQLEHVSIYKYVTANALGFQLGDTKNLQNYLRHFKQTQPKTTVKSIDRTITKWYDGVKVCCSSVTWAGIPKFSSLLGQQWLLALCRKTCLCKDVQKSRVLLRTQASSFPQTKNPNRPLTCAVLLLHVLTQNLHYSTLLYFLPYLLKMIPKYDAKFNPAPGSWIPAVHSGSSCIPQPKWWAGQGKSWELTALRHHLVSVVPDLPLPIGNTFPFTKVFWINRCLDGGAHPSPLGSTQSAQCSPTALCRGVPA